jgi:hypothetical protein
MAFADVFAGLSSFMSAGYIISMEIVADIYSGVLWQAWRHCRYARGCAVRRAAEELAAATGIL